MIGWLLLLIVALPGFYKAYSWVYYTHWLWSGGWLPQGWERDDWLYLLGGMMAVSTTAGMISTTMLNIRQLMVVALPRKKSLRYTREILLYALLVICALGILATLVYDGGALIKALVPKVVLWMPSPVFHPS
jgi:hypothetical protein